jgi:putative phosphoesterase
MKIGLISDIHATTNPLQEALEVFSREGVDKILCAGDIAGYGHELDQTVALLQENNCQAIIGNHDFWWLESEEGRSGGAAENYLRSLPTVVDLSAAGKNVHMVHASPPGSLMEGIKLLDENAVSVPGQKAFWADYLKNFPFDVLVVGHTHQVFSEKLGDVLVVNPGSTMFNHTCVVLTLPEMTTQLFALSGKEPVMSWNWGLFYSDIET